MAKSRSRGKGRRVPAALDKAFADIEEMLCEAEGFLRALDLMSTSGEVGNGTREALAFGVVAQAAQERMERVRARWNDALGAFESKR